MCVFSQLRSCFKNFYREIFGPLLPILRVPTVDEAIRYINAKYLLLSNRILLDADCCLPVTTRLHCTCSRRTESSVTKVRLGYIIFFEDKLMLVQCSKLLKVAPQLRTKL